MSARAWRWWFGTTLVLGVVLSFLHVLAAVVAVAVMSVAGMLALRGIGAEFAALDKLADELSASRGSATAAVPDDLPGQAGQLASAFLGVAAGQDAALERVRRIDEMLEASPGGVMMVDLDGRIQLVNPALCRLIPPRTEPAGRQPLEVFSVLELQEVIDEALAGEAAAERHASTGDYDLSILGLPTASGALAVVRDITNYRRAEKARTDFVANVSHELRTPITAIMGFAETVMEDADELPASLRPMIEAIHRNGRRLSGLFDDLLELYRVETRRRELPRESVLLAPLLGEAVVVAVDRAFSNGQKFEVSCPPDLCAWANPEALGAIVGNLASNACKYTPLGGTVTVRAFRNGDEVEIEVEDTGRGIPGHHIERIFERFYRIDDVRGRKVGGAGLGLAIVKHLAQATQCTVTVRSQEDVGSVFTIHVPATSEAHVARTWSETLGA